MAAIIYTSATEHINKYPYDVMVQAHFAGLHKEVEKGIFWSPIYEPLDHRQKQRSKISISKMVELFTSKSSFDVIHDKDILSILHQIDAYVEEVYPLRQSNPEIDKYLKKILSLRERVYDIFRRVLNRHPQWKSAYEDKKGIFQVIAALYNPKNLGLVLPETLLEDLRICPTIREYQKMEAVNSTSPAQPGVYVPGQVVYDV